MPYIHQLFDRACLQQLGSFLMYGTEAPMIAHGDYEDRLSDSQQTLLEACQPLMADNSTYERVMDALYAHLSVAESVYLEIGLQLGAQWMLQLTHGPGRG